MRYVYAVVAIDDKPRPNVRVIPLLGVHGKSWLALNHYIAALECRSVPIKDAAIIFGQINMKRRLATDERSVILHEMSTPQRGESIRLEKWRIS